MGFESREGGVSTEVPWLSRLAEAFVADKLFCGTTGEAKRTAIERYARSSAVEDIRCRNTREKIVSMWRTTPGQSNYSQSMLSSRVYPGLYLRLFPDKAVEVAIPRNMWKSSVERLDKELDV
jgi:hypothetical protein